MRDMQADISFPSNLRTITSTISRPLPPMFLAVSLSWVSGLCSIYFLIEV